MYDIPIHYHCYYLLLALHTVNHLRKKYLINFQKTKEKRKSIHIQGSAQLQCWRCDPCPDPHDNSSSQVQQVTCTVAQTVCVVSSNTILNEQKKKLLFVVLFRLEKYCQSFKSSITNFERLC